jgi:hypothetical protein
VSCRELPEIGGNGGRGRARHTICRKLSESCGNGERGEDVLGCQIVAEMGGGDRGPRGICRKLPGNVRNGGGKGLTRVAFTC